MRQESFLIRRALVEDLKALSQVELRSAVYEHRLEPLSFSEVELENLWKERLLSGKFEILLAIKDSVLLGFIGLIAAAEKDGFIQALYVDPNFYRSGVGRALLKTAERIFIIRKCPCIRLYVEPANVGGMRFYQSLGFTKTKHKHRHLIMFIKELSGC